MSAPACRHACEGDREPVQRSWRPGAVTSSLAVFLMPHRVGKWAVRDNLLLGATAATTRRSVRRSMQSSSASYHHSVDNHTSPWGPAGNTQFLARGQFYSVLCPQWFASESGPLVLLPPTLTHAPAPTPPSPHCHLKTAARGHCAENPACYCCCCCLQCHHWSPLLGLRHVP